MKKTQTARVARACGKFMAGGAAAALVFGAGQAAASGYAVKEQSVSAQGYSFAGVSSAPDDISSMFFNPAAIGMFNGMNAAGGGSIIIPSAELNVTSATSIVGSPLGGGSGSTDEFAAVPATYAAARINEKIALGLSVNAPFGLVTDYGDNWAGRYHGTKSALTTINVAPTIAFNPVPNVSIAAGVQIQYADAELDNAVDFGTIGAAAAASSAAAAGAFAAAGVNPTPGQNDGYASLTGDDIGWGFTLGVLAEPMPGTRFGVGFRSEIEHEFDGSVDFTHDQAGVVTVLNQLQTLQGLPTLFQDGGGDTAITTPAQINIGASHMVTPELMLLAEAQWTQWSAFDELVIKFDNPAQADSITEEKWEDSWFFAVGARYQPNEKMKLRFGVGYDESPVPDAYRTPRIPDTDRWWISLGGSYAVTDHMTLDLGYTYIHADDAKIDLKAADVGSTFRGNLAADVEADVHILTIGGTMHF